MKKRVLSLLLSILLVLSLAPVSALAEGDDPGEPDPAPMSDPAADPAPEVDGVENDLTDPAPQDEEDVLMGDPQTASDGEDITPDPDEMNEEDNTQEVPLPAVNEGNAPSDDLTPATESVQVVFTCDPTDLVLTVWAKPEADEEPAPILPEEDGAYLLLPGEYLYTAEAEGYAPAEEVPFTVEAADTPQQIAVTLSPLPADDSVIDPDPETQPEDMQPAEEDKFAERTPQTEDEDEKTPLVRPESLTFARTRGVGDEYSLVSSASQLSLGDEIILLSFDDNSFCVLGGDFQGIQTVISGLTAVTAPSGTMPLTLKQAPNGWILSTGSAFVAVDGASLTTVTKAQFAAIWTISISNNDAVLSCSAGNLCFDGASFYCGSGGNAISIYSIPYTGGDSYEDEGILFNMGDRYVTLVGDIINLSFHYIGYNGISFDEVIWSSSDESVVLVTIDEYGYPDFDPVGIGTAVITVTPVNGQQGDSLTVIVLDNTLCGENLTWSFDEDSGTLTISGNGDMVDALHPCPWQDFKQLITKVVLSNGVTSIAGLAFSRCNELTSIAIPDSVTDIGYSAFFGCTGLASITIPGNVSAINE